MEKEGDDMSEERNIGGIGNYYGGLAIKNEDRKCFWSIENYDGHDWEEIPQSLFDELNRFQDFLESKTKGISNESP